MALSRRFSAAKRPARAAFRLVLSSVVALCTCLAFPAVAPEAYAYEDGPRPTHVASQETQPKDVSVDSPAPGSSVDPPEVSCGDMSEADSIVVDPAAPAALQYAVFPARQTPTVTSARAPVPAWLMGLIGANIAANAADLVTTARGLDQGAREVNPATANPWMRYSLKAAVTVIPSVFAVKWWREGRKTESVLVAAIPTIIAAVAAGYNQSQLRAR
jgi:hypothetical protein